MCSKWQQQQLYCVCLRAAAGTQIVLHPRWGSAVYPATLFAKAPLQLLLEAIKEVEAELQGTGLSQP